MTLISKGTPGGRLCGHSLRTLGTCTAPHPQGTLRVPHWNGLGRAGLGRQLVYLTRLPVCSPLGPAAPGPGPLSSSVLRRRKPRPEPPTCSVSLPWVPSSACCVQRTAPSLIHFSVFIQESHSENCTPQVREDHTRHQHPDPRMGHGTSEAHPVSPEATLHPQGDLSSDVNTAGWFACF